jgi:membrane-bound serine protease (ClpP class)
MLVKRLLWSVGLSIVIGLLAVSSLCLLFPGVSSARPGWGPVVVIDIEGSINPAKDEYLRTSLEAASSQNARLFVVRLNTPGGLLASTKTMVENLLEADIPTVVYVTPRGGGAISAGVFITLAGHFAYMSPGTNIGAAHPVSSGGGDIKGDMRAKLENYAASLIKAIAEQRGRNAEWAEQAVRESVAITADEALTEGVIDGIAGNLDRLLDDLENKTISIKGDVLTLHGLRSAPQELIEQGFRNTLIDILCDPNIAILLGFGAMLGFVIEFYTPGGFIAGTVGVICLILSLIAGQTLPINHGGVALLVLAGVLFIVECVVPSFGFWGIAGIVCLFLGSIYFVDTTAVWTAAGFAVNLILVSVFALVLACFMFGVGYAVFVSKRGSLVKKKDSLVGQTGRIFKVFSGVEGREFAYGRIEVEGRTYPADFRIVDGRKPSPGDSVTVVDLDQTGRRVVTKPADC